MAVLLVGPVQADDAPETRLYDVDSDQSRVLIYVHRAGLMRRAGHDHVMASEHVNGQVSYSADGESFAELQFPLTDLVVDAPQYRERFDLDPEVSESSIRGTRRNMLEKLLDVDAHPDVRVTAVAEVAGAERPTLEVTIELQGATAVYELPVELTIGSETLSVNGQLTIRHSDFGMRPFRAAAGLLRVADEIDIHFEIVAAIRTR